MQQSALPCGHEVLQPQVRDECGQDDGERRGEAFEDVVGVLDDRRDDQAAQRLEKSGKQAGDRWIKVQVRRRVLPDLGVRTTSLIGSCNHGLPAV